MSDFNPVRSRIMQGLGCLAASLEPDDAGIDILHEGLLHGSTGDQQDKSNAIPEDMPGLIYASQSATLYQRMGM